MVRPDLFLMRYNVNLMNTNARLISTWNLPPELNSIFEQIEEEGNGVALAKVAAMLRISTYKQIDVQDHEMKHEHFQNLSAELLVETEDFEGPWSELQLGQLTACLQYAWITHDTELVENTNRCLAIALECLRAQGQPYENVQELCNNCMKLM